MTNSSPTRNFRKGKEFYCMTQDSISFLGSSSQGGQVEEISRKLKEKNREEIGAKTEQKQRKNKALEIWQAEESLCEISTMLQNHSATLWSSLREFSQLRRRFWHTSATSQHRSPHLAAAKRIAKCCEKGFKIRARHSHRPSISFLKPHRANLRSSSPTIRSGQVSTTRNGANQRSQESVPDPIPDPPQPKAIPHPVKPATPKPPAKCYLTRSRGWPLQKRPRVESSEPIYLTKQSPEPSPIPSPVPTPVPSPIPMLVPSLIPMPVPSPVPSTAPQEKSQEPQAPLLEPQIPSETALEEVIRRPMLPQPPIEGNLDCRVRPFHSELCFDIAAFRVRPELAQTFNLLRRYHMEHLLTQRDFFYPRIAMDFYQSMTTNQVRDPTLIHFTIDGRHGILGARHIAEALQIPYEPTQFDNFRAWANPTELEMVRTLSRGAANRSHLLRGELPPIMFLIDAFLHHNLYPLQHWTQRRGVLLEALYKMSEGFFFGPHHLILAALLYFEEKPEQPQPAARRASPRHIPEGITVAAPAIPKAPPAAPASSQPSTSAEPRMAIPISEYRELCRALETLTASQSSLAQEMAAIRACQEQMLATQAQQAAILRQLQLHFDLPPVVEPSTSIPAEPHSHPSESHPPELQAPTEAPTEEADPSA
uniref:Uncharacterized protein n=1 Tax=Vitis vinifera TaxID=29760 RepID=A5BYC5_VITVI|nr:hypothetical protein VITISV_029174 [Vitis vinifera]